MAMPVVPTARRYSVEEVLAWPPDGNRYEVVHGELLVTPPPATPHQLVVTRLVLALGTYLRAPECAGAATVIAGPVGFFHAAEVYVEPDLVVAVPEQITTDWRTMRHLLLAVEVVSPSSARGDRLVKRRAYQEAGVETYWIVDPDRAVVEVWQPGDELAEIVTGDLTWRVAPNTPDLRINLPQLFAQLPGARQE